VPAKRRTRRRPPDALIECRFLVPSVRDSNRRPHDRELWQTLADALHRRFGGFTGPEGPIPGGYTSRSGRRVEDRSWRYTVSVPRSAVRDLRVLLRRVGRSFDQECIYFVVGIDVEFVASDTDVGLEEG
jgi:hypothetical protein